MSGFNKYNRYIYFSPAKKTPTKQSTEKTGEKSHSLLHKWPHSLSWCVLYLTDKLAVMVAMDTFLWLKNDYEAEEGNMSVYSREIEDQRFG